MIEPVRRPALWESVLERMRAAILSGELGSGEKLVEAVLAERFGTSRGPIRQAVRELVREGLVAEFPRRGHVVSTPTAHDLAEVYGVREALEVAAVRVAVTRIRDDDLAELDAHLAAFERGKGDYLARSVHDLAFHRSLVALAGNGRIDTVNEQMLTQTAHLLRAAATANPLLQTAIRPAAHRDILQALRARDAAVASAAVEAHYRYAEERLFPGLASRG
jgi:DNA-binding GntR family transcriptional regulator